MCRCTPPSSVCSPKGWRPSALPSWVSRKAPRSPRRPLSRSASRSPAGSCSRVGCRCGRAARSRAVPTGAPARACSSATALRTRRWTWAARGSRGSCWWRRAHRSTSRRSVMSCTWRARRTGSETLSPSSMMSSRSPVAVRPRQLRVASLGEHTDHRVLQPRACTRAPWWVPLLVKARLHLAQAV